MSIFIFQQSNLFYRIASKFFYDTLKQFLFLYKMLRVRQPTVKHKNNTFNCHQTYFCKQDETWFSNLKKQTTKVSKCLYGLSDRDFWIKAQSLSPILDERVKLLIEEICPLLKCIATSCLCMRFSHCVAFWKYLYWFIDVYGNGE